jgi:hypothetical protein
LFRHELILRDRCHRLPTHDPTKSADRRALALPSTDFGFIEIKVEIDSLKILRV